MFAAVNRAPVIGVEFEIGYAPLFAHGAENLGQMFLRVGIGAVEHAPGSVRPAAKADLAGIQRLPRCILHKPVRMLPQHDAVRLRDKRCQPHARKKISGANGGERRRHVPEFCGWLQPVAERRAIAFINLNEPERRQHCFELSHGMGNNLLVTRSAHAIPSAPAHAVGQRRRRQWRMIARDSGAQLVQQHIAVTPRKRDKFLQPPRFARREFQPFRVHRHAQRFRSKRNAANEFLARTKAQQRLPAGGQI